MGMKVVSVAVALAAAVGFGADQGATAPEFIWRDVKGVRWSFHGNARIVGDELVCVADETNRNAYAIGYCDLSEYDGKPLQMQIVASAEDVTRSRKSYLGFRFMLSYLDLDMGGNRVWPNGGALYGTKPPTEIAWRDINGKRRGKCEIQLGLHDCTGRAVYNLKTLQARATSPLVPKINEGYKVKYPDRVRNAPRGRGVMLGGMDDAAWDTLQSWGANLVRHQIGLGGTGPATNHEAYVAGYLRNYDRCLDELEKRLVAARKRGIRVCIDQHSSPGGRCDAGDPAEWRGDCRMFHDPVYAQLFIDCWVKLARRMAPYRDAIYGYDLINEACHNAPALPDGDIVNLQRRCAEAIRAVDPDTTIILESMYCDPAWFARMSAIRMDNVIYQVHLYYPHDYTHQGILNPVDHLEYWPDPKKGWNRDFLRRSLKPVIDFQREHDAKMFVGEFSAIAWAPNAEGYIRDCISIFEELGWDWTYHAYREFDGWNVEKEPIRRGRDAKDFRLSADNPRKRVLLQGLRGEIVGHFIPALAQDTGKVAADAELKDNGNGWTGYAPWKIKGECYPVTNRDYVVKYPQRVLDLPVLKGVQIPAAACTDANLDELKSWNAKLIRRQSNWSRLKKDWNSPDLEKAYFDWIRAEAEDVRATAARAAKRGIYVTFSLPPPGGHYSPKDKGHNGAEGKFLFEPRFADLWVRGWRLYASLVKGVPNIYGYDLVNEPHHASPAAKDCDYWNVQRRAAEAIRAVDPDTTIIVTCAIGGNPPGYDFMSPLAMDNVIYTVHVYLPHRYSHQGLGAKHEAPPPEKRIPYPSDVVDAAYQRQSLQRVRDFQVRHHARMFVGEFSAVVWAPGAAEYVQEYLKLFKEWKWDWTYHAYRENPLWSVQHAYDEASGKIVPSEDNPRRHVLLDALKDEQ